MSTNIETTQNQDKTTYYGRERAYRNAASNMANPASNADHAAATAKQENTSGDVVPGLSVNSDSSSTVAAKPKAVQSSPPTAKKEVTSGDVVPSLTVTDSSSPAAAKPEREQQDDKVMAGADTHTTGAATQADTNTAATSDTTLSATTAETTTLVATAAANPVATDSEVPNYVDALANVDIMGNPVTPDAPSTTSSATTADDKPPVLTPPGTGSAQGSAPAATISLTTAALMESAADASLQVRIPVTLQEQAANGASVTYNYVEDCSGFMTYNNLGQQLLVTALHCAMPGQPIEPDGPTVIASGNPEVFQNGEFVGLAEPNDADPLTDVATYTLPIPIASQVAFPVAQFPAPGPDDQLISVSNPMHSVLQQVVYPTFTGTSSEVSPSGNTRGFEDVVPDLRGGSSGSGVLDASGQDFAYWIGMNDMGDKSGSSLTPSTAVYDAINPPWSIDLTGGASSVNGGILRAPLAASTYPTSYDRGFLNRMNAWTNSDNATTDAKTTTSASAESTATTAAATQDDSAYLNLDLTGEGNSGDLLKAPLATASLAPADISLAPADTSAKASDTSAKASYTSANKTDTSTETAAAAAKTDAPTDIAADATKADAPTDIAADATKADAQTDLAADATKTDAPTDIAADAPKADAQTDLAADATKTDAPTDIAADATKTTAPAPAGATDSGSPAAATADGSTGLGPGVYDFTPWGYDFAPLFQAQAAAAKPAAPTTAQPPADAAAAQPPADATTAQPPADAAAAQPPADAAAAQPPADATTAQPSAAPPASDAGSDAGSSGASSGVAADSASAGNFDWPGLDPNALAAASNCEDGDAGIDCSVS